jgi:hypothetical protein
LSGADAIHQHEVTLDSRMIGIYESGSSCKLYEEKNPSCDKPWRKTVNKNLHIQILKIYFFKFLFNLLKLKKLNHRYFKYQIDLAFIQGYQRANQKRSNSVSY